MKILGIDPGYAIVGYGVVVHDKGRYRSLEYGAITTEAGEDFNLRLKQVYDGVCDVIRRHQPEALAIEKLFFQSNQTTVIGVAEARGVILLAAAQAGIEIYEYTPLQMKMALTGYGRALKPQIMEMTKRLLNLEAVPKPDDTADALAMAICHGQMAGSSIKRTVMRNTPNQITGNKLPPRKVSSGAKGIHLIDKINEANNGKKR